MVVVLLALAGATAMSSIHRVEGKVRKGAGRGADRNRGGEW